MSANKLIVRFQLPNGERLALAAEFATTLDTLKDKIWQKKQIAGDRKQHVIRLLHGEIFFQSRHKVAQVYKVARAFFEEAAEQQEVDGISPPLIIDLLLMPIPDIGHNHPRETRIATNISGVALMVGYLYRASKATFTSTLKKRYYVLHDITLFVYESDQHWRSGTVPALDYICMGAVTARDVMQGADGSERDGIEPIQHKHWKSPFEINADSVGKGKITLLAESDDEMHQWVDAINLVHARRTKSVCVAVCEELSARNEPQSGIRSEGIFRLSGSKESVQQLMQQLMHQWNLALYPRLSEAKDDNAVAGLLKTALRNQQPPLLSYTLYNQWLTVISAGAEGSPQRIQRAREVMQQLPASNQYFMAYFMHFLRRVASHADVNMMTSKNLAVVIAPNILRPAVEDIATFQNDNNAVLAAVHTLIEHAAQLWPSDQSRSASRSVSSTGNSSKTTEAQAQPLYNAASAPASSNGHALQHEDQSDTDSYIRHYTPQQQAMQANLTAGLNSTFQELQSQRIVSTAGTGSAARKPPPIPATTLTVTTESTSAFDMISQLQQQWDEWDSHYQSLRRAQIAALHSLSSQLSITSSISTATNDAVETSLEKIQHSESEWRQSAVSSMSSTTATVHHLAAQHSASALYTSSSTPSQSQQQSPKFRLTAPLSTRISSALSNSSELDDGAYHFPPAQSQPAASYNSPSPATTPDPSSAVLMSPKTGSLRQRPPPLPPAFNKISSLSSSSASTSPQAASTSPHPHQSPSRPQLTTTTFDQQYSQSHATTDADTPSTTTTGELFSAASSGSSHSALPLPAGKRQTAQYQPNNFNSTAPAGFEVSESAAQQQPSDTVRESPSRPQQSLRRATTASERRMSNRSTESLPAVAKFNYQCGQRREDITLARGDDVTVYDRSDKNGAGWYYGQNQRTEEVGYFPATYIRLLATE